MEFRVGQRVNVEEYGEGRIVAIDKFYAIVYVLWDEPYDQHGSRKLAMAEEWLAERGELVGRA
jgi:hypothetical protein